VVAKQLKYVIAKHATRKKRITYSNYV
jgi:hypothetical protein